MAESDMLAVQPLGADEAGNFSLPFWLDHRNGSVDAMGGALPETFGAFNNSKVQSKSAVSSIIMFSVGVLGNSIALILMATAQREQKQTMFYKLIAGLFCTDLIGQCVTSPIVIMVYVTGREMQQGAALCHFFAFVMVLAGFSTMSLICAMSIERYICICHPCTYQCKMPKSYPKFAMCFSWLFSTFIASLPLMGLGHNVVQFPNTWCFFDATGRSVSDDIFGYIYIIIGFSNLAVTFYCNIANVITVLSLRRRQKALSAMQGTTARPNRSLNQRIAEMHMIAMNFGVTLVFTTCYGPLMMAILLFRTDLIDDLNKTYILLLTVRIASFNQIFDPLVYILVRRDLRWKLISFFRTILGRGRCDNYHFQNNSVETPLHGKLAASAKNICASNVSVNKLPEVDNEVSFGSFCFRCLCDPPSYSSARSARARPSCQSQVASYKAVSCESLLNPGAENCVIRQPSPREEMELRVMITQNGGIKR